MAQIFPNKIPADVVATRSERAVFEALKSNLSDEYCVYFSTPFITSERAEQGEVDFIVLHPERGMLVIECKGGGIERDHDGSWYRLKGKKRERLAKTPAEQAKKQVEALVTKFRESCGRLFGPIKGRFPLSYGWSLAFPLSRWDSENIPPDVEPEIFFDREILTNTEDLIERAMAFWQRGRGEPAQLSLEEFHVFRRCVLSPELKLVPDLTNIERPLVRLSDKQARVANMLVDSKRLMVSGGSGTGKSLLALHCAQSMASEGKRVLLVCANALMAQNVRIVTEGVARDLRLANEETILLQKGDFLESTLSFERPDDDKMTIPFRKVQLDSTRVLPAANVTTAKFHRPDLQVKSERWVEQLPGSIDAVDFLELVQRSASLVNEPFTSVSEGPALILRALGEQKVGPWDSIIVDQAHDLSTDALEVLEAGVAPGGQLTVFYDPTTAMTRIGPVVDLASD